VLITILPVDLLLLSGLQDLGPKNIILHFAAELNGASVSRSMCGGKFWPAREAFSFVHCAARDTATPMTA